MAALERLETQKISKLRERISKRSRVIRKSKKKRKQRKMYVILAMRLVQAPLMPNSQRKSLKRLINIIARKS